MRKEASNNEAWIDPAVFGLQKEQVVLTNILLTLVLSVCGLIILGAGLISAVAPL